MKSIVFFFLIFTSLVNSQPRSGEVIYEIKTINLEVANPSDFVESLIESARKQRFKLHFNESGSNFIRENLMNGNDDTPEEIKVTASLAFTTDYTHCLVLNNRYRLLKD